ncbi:MAG: hypothetical protein K2O41_06405 [Clostridia bacterium]|nr:hypothetical protein [Clostridia bacterium]
MRRKRECVKQRKNIRVKTYGKISGTATVLSTYILLALQAVLILSAYAVAAYFCKIFFFVSLGLTALCCVLAVAFKKTVNAKISWLVLLILSCGSGYIIYFLAAEPVCLFIRLKKHKAAFMRTRKFNKQFIEPDAPTAVKDICNYLYSSADCPPYFGAGLKYFSSATDFFEDFFNRLESAEKFIFIEFFIIADGKLLQRLTDILSRKASAGVEVRLIYDGVGSLGTVSPKAINRLKKGGVNLKKFAPPVSLFSFGLNFRDHRKIVVVDGQTSYVCGCNIADECVNACNVKGEWKDAGIRLDGECTDALTLAFIRQWDVCAKTKTATKNYLATQTDVAQENCAVTVPYFSGPEYDGSICREVYLEMIKSAQKKLYIFTPYLAPDKAFLKAIKSKAKSGVDVRLVLPTVPDWKFLYYVTLSNAQSLIKSGAKIYFAENAFAHGKVILSEACASVGSANLDMRSFNLEYDNGVFTNDTQVLNDIEEDFNSVFSANSPVNKIKRNPIKKLAAQILKLVAPLM